MQQRAPARCSERSILPIIARPQAPLGAGRKADQCKFLVPTAPFAQRSAGRRRRDGDAMGTRLYILRFNTSRSL